MYQCTYIPGLEGQIETTQAQRQHAPINGSPAHRFVEIDHVLVNTVSSRSDRVADLARAADHNRHHRDRYTREIPQLAQKTARASIDGAGDLRQPNSLEVG